MPSDLFNRLQRILPLAEKVVDKIVSEETDILKELMPRMFGVMYRVGRFSCDYVKHGRWSPSGYEQAPIIPGRKGGGHVGPRCVGVKKDEFRMTNDESSSNDRMIK